MENIWNFIVGFFTEFVQLLETHMKFEYEFSGYEVFIGMFLLSIAVVLSLKQTYENRSLKKKQKKHDIEIKTMYNGIDYLSNRLDDRDSAHKKLIHKIQIFKNRIAYLEHMPLKQLEKYLVSNHVIPSEEVFHKEIDKTPTN